MYLNKHIKNIVGYSQVNNGGNLSYPKKIYYIVKKSIYINGKSKFNRLSEINQDVWLSW